MDKKQLFEIIDIVKGYDYIVEENKQLENTIHNLEIEYDEIIQAIKDLNLYDTVVQQLEKNKQELPF